jgi:hypothetical protein
MATTDSTKARTPRKGREEAEVSQQDSRAGYVWAVYAPSNASELPTIHSVHGSEMKGLRRAVAGGMKCIRLQYDQTLADALKGGRES